MTTPRLDFVEAFRMFMDKAERLKVEYQHLRRAGYSYPAARLTLKEDDN